MYRILSTARSTALTLAILTALLTGCGSSNSSSISPNGQGNISSSFSVASITPASGAMNVTLSSAVQIVFSAAASTSTVNSTNIAVTDSSGAISGSVSYNSSNDTATFTPSAALVAGTTYNVKVSGVTSASGTALTSAFTSTFTTASSAASSGASMQYQATLYGTTGNGGSGQVTVDTAGNVAIQLQGAAPHETLTAIFCSAVPTGQGAPNCFSVGAVSTDANGNSSLTAMFPKSGAWVGDFQLVADSVNPNEEGFQFAYQTGYGPGYVSTLQPDSTIDGGIFNRPDNDAPQAPLTSGTITYSSSPAPKGSLTFTLTGAPANDYIEIAEGGLAPDDYYSINSGTTNSAGDVALTGAPSGQGGDIFDVSPQNGQEGWEGGFSVPVQ